MRVYQRGNKWWFDGVVDGERQRFALEASIRNACQTRGGAMSQAAGQSIAVRISPKAIATIKMLAEKTNYTPSRVAYIILDGTLPSVETVTKSYESGILSVARWIDKLMTWAFSGVKKRAVKKAAELQAEGKVKAPPKETFAVWLPNEVVERLDIIATRFYMTRGKLMALMLEASMNRFTVGTGVNLAVFHDFVLSLRHDLHEELIGQPTDRAAKRVSASHTHRRD